MDWLPPLFEGPLDLIGFVLFVLVFPLYHGFYPWLARLWPNRAARTRFDLFRESWIEGLIERRDLIAAAQQTRNLTMVNSILVSSSLILMGLTANVLVQLPVLDPSLPHPADWSVHPEVVREKLYLLILVFALAFSFCMTSLRYLGNFVLVIGADPKLVEREEGSPVRYFSALINRASHRYTLGVRAFYSAFPLFAWLFDARIFVALCLFWGIKLVFFQDFSHLLRGDERR
ncbi:MAG: DUF599 domain-containing protein [Acidobacteria bacterium]|nr:MAG: DUF599 domain-containing protein [Acidobacteriota bacterium]